jgi:hypothetical protein
MKLGAWIPRCLKSWGPENRAVRAHYRGKVSEIVQLGVLLIGWGLVLRTVAVVPGYLKRYSMQVDMPEQKLSV